jgi:hypothetical protein
MEWAKRFEQGLETVRARITDWSRDPTPLTDEDKDPPSSRAFARAMEIVEGLEVQVMDRVPPQGASMLNLRGASVGSGGEISIELAGGRYACTYRIEADGSVTKMIFRDHRLIGTPQKLERW